MRPIWTQIIHLSIVPCLWCSSCVITKRYESGTIASAAVAKVAVPVEMMFPEKTGEGGFWTGMLSTVATGAALGASSSYSPASAYMAGANMGYGGGENRRGVIFDESLRSFFVSELQRCLERRLGEAGEFAMTGPDNAEGSISVDVFQWGFVDGRSASAQMLFEKKRIIPTAWVTIEMSGASGGVLWRKEINTFTDASPSSALIPRRNLGDYNKALMRQDLALIADAVAEIAADSITSSKKP